MSIPGQVHEQEYALSASAQLLAKEANLKEKEKDKKEEVTATKDTVADVQLSGIEARLDRLSEQMELCLAEVHQLRASGGSVSVAAPGSRRSHRVGDKPKPEGYLPAIPSGGPLRATEGPRHSLKSVVPAVPAGDVHILAQSESFHRHAMTDDGLPENQSQSMVSFRDSRVDEADVVHSDSDPAAKPTRRKAQPARSVDLKIAWQMHGRTLRQEFHPPDEETLPLMRLVYRSRADYVWELLDDPSSSLAAWCISTMLKLLVILSVITSSLETSNSMALDPVIPAVLETVFDAVFLVEFACRIGSAPSKRTYLTDPLNWADLLSAFGLPLRAGMGFLVPTPPSHDQEVLQTILLFFLPLVRLLKLLRYFESFRLLIDACRNSAESLPVLTYIMGVITLFSATAIYLAEPRTNIPTMQHSLWLALVTMTTVGYGDYYPVSVAGYLAVSALTIVSVLFLALPVGIIGFEFTTCWQNRESVLLLTRMRKGLRKWGYSSKDVKILFEYVDVDGDGSLDLAEFIELVRQMRVGVGADAAVQIFELFDDDANGSIDYDEFLRHIYPHDYVREQQAITQMEKSRGKVQEALQHLEDLRARSNSPDASIDSLAELAGH